MHRDDPVGDHHLRRLAVLLSGSGRTLDNVIQHIECGAIPGSIEMVVSSRANVRGVDIARDAGLPLRVARRRDYHSTNAFSEQLFGILRNVDPDLVVCAGFLSKIAVPADFTGRIVNIHPSLLPLFGGKGFYGARIHQAVLDSGMKVSGCTVHFVDNEYDAGPIICQQCVPVLSGDTVETLAARVFSAECAMYPQVIADILKGRVRLDGRDVHYAIESENP